MRLKKYFCLIIILLIFSSISINFLLISQINYNVGKYESDENLINNIDPKSADPINPLDIIQNATEIYRLFESINFTLTLDTYLFPFANYTFMQISFTNGSVKNYPMILNGPDNYICEYKPEYNAPLGVQNVSFLIYDENDILLNDHTTYKSFVIKTNYMANFNSSGYYIEDILYAELTLNDFISNNRTFEFAWNVTIVDSDNEISQNNLFNLENDIVQFKFKVKNETFSKSDDGIYYVKVNMTEKISSKVYATYFPFDVLNNIPKIIASSINFSKEIIYRTDTCRVTLNVTDVETLPENLIVNMILEDPKGKELPIVVLNHQEGYVFTKTFSIPANNPVGRYKVNITAKDQNDKTGYYITYLNVENNPPEIHSFKINGISMNESVTILYGKDLVFTFNVSDAEGIAYVKVALIDKNNEWFNITREYIGPETRITFRTVDLRKGTWYVYVFVTDTDGETIGLIDDYNLAPQQIKIISDVLSGVLPWITFIVGIILGILAGIGGSYKLVKRRLLEKKITSSKKKEEVSSVRKKQEKKAIKLTKEEPIKEEEKDKIEQEKEEKVIYRKIKRKLK